MRLTKRFSGFTAAFAMLTLAGCSDKATEESPAESAPLADSDETSLESDNRDNDLYVAGPKRSGTLEIDAANLAYLYHRMSGEPASVVRMMTDPLGQRFDDEFARKRFVDEHFAEFSKLVDESVSAENYVVRLNGRLEDYDFDREGFPINGLFERTMVEFSASPSGSEGLDFALALEGTGGLSFLPMAPDKAEALDFGNNGRRVNLEVSFTPYEAGWEKVRSEQRRTVVGTANSVKVSTPDSKEIAAVDNGKAPPSEPLRLYSKNPFAKANLTNPWSAENAPEAVLDRYSWIIDERWRMKNQQQGDAFEEAMTLNGGAAGGCIGQFGMSQCKRLATARSNFISRCEQSIAAERRQECYAIRRLPYTELEADAY